MKGSIFFIFVIAMVTICFLINAPMVFGEPKMGVIVVDLQGDFTTYKNGSLAVEGTDEAFVNKVRKVTQELRAKGYPTIRHPGLAPRRSYIFLFESRREKTL